MTEQNKELFKEFVSFCENQPADRDINHSCWHTCAVGQFFGWSGFEDEDLTSISELLGKGSKIHRLIGNGNCPDNYGEFTKFLKEYL